MPKWMDRILKCSLRATIIAGMAIFIGNSSCGARIATGEISQAEIAQDLSSTNWAKRSRAVEALQSLPAENWTPSVRDALIGTLEMEEQRLQDRLTGRVPSTSYPEMAHEAFGEYFSALIGLVMKVDDPRALPLIIDSTYSSDPRILGYIVQHGGSALPLVLARLHRAGQRSDVGSERAMLDTLTDLVLLNRAKKLQPPLSISDLTIIRDAGLQFLDNHSPWVATHAARALAIVADPQDQIGVREAFARLLSDPDHNRREIALSAMRDITDPRFIPVDQLNEIAKHDDFRLSGPGAGYPAGAYPLRRQAEQVLHSLRLAE